MHVHRNSLLINLNHDGANTFVKAAGWGVGIGKLEMTEVELESYFEAAYVQSTFRID